MSWRSRFTTLPLRLLSSSIGCWQRVRVHYKSGLRFPSRASLHSRTINAVVGLGFSAVSMKLLLQELDGRNVIGSSCAAYGEAADEPSIVGSDKNMQEFLTQLARILEEDQIELDIEERKQRGKPWSSYHSATDFPAAIIFPNNTTEVSKIMKLCFKHKISVVPFGGGTSLEGQTLASSRGSISLDFSNMQSIVELNEKDLDATVQAGLGYIQLNDLLREKNIWFPLDPGPGATIGGMCACRCSGSTAVRYGSMRDNVLGLTVVLADGSIVKTGTRARKSSAGYDLTRLMIGSEGTLGVVTEATLKLHGIPKVSHALRISFPRRGVVDASMTAKDTLNCGVNIGRCELLDDKMVKIINDTNPSMAHPWPEVTTLMYELTGLSVSAVEEQAEIVKQIAARNGGDIASIYTATTKEETREFWKLRKECLWAAMSQYPDREPMITDVCVPLSQLPGLIKDTKEDIDASSLPCPIIAHAGDGNFHVFIMFKASDPREVSEAKELAKRMAEKAILLGGTCTGEHGVGTGKKELLKKEAGEGAMQLMETIKQAVDPANILNPGKVFDLTTATKTTATETAAATSRITKQ